MKHLKTLTITLFIFALMSFDVRVLQSNAIQNNVAYEQGGDQVSPVVGLNLGNLAPEIIDTDPNGKSISLSSLRGKLVLIDFWASWCGPCRHENPAVVKAYNKYKDKKFENGSGFTIFSVSLDVKGEAWKYAIEKDGLAWEYHVSDLQGWSSRPAAVYGVNAIPSNFLIDEKGIIIQKNLRGNELMNELEKLIIK